jgi:uncharacterized protein (DUF697 family)
MLGLLDECRNRCIENFDSMCREQWPEIQSEIPGRFDSRRAELTGQIEERFRDQQMKRQDIEKRREAAQAIATRVSGQLAPRVGLIPVPLADWASVTAWWTTLIREELGVFGFTPNEASLQEWLRDYSGNAKTRTTVFKFIPLLGWIPGGIRGAVLARRNTKRFGDAFADALADCAIERKGVLPLIADPRRVAQIFSTYGPFER